MKLEKASSIITKANAMKHDYEKLQEEMKAKDQEVIFSMLGESVVGFATAKSKC